MHLLDTLSIYYGDCSPALARVYAQVHPSDDRAGLQLSGYVRGPFCEFARTLPTTTPLEDLRPLGDSHFTGPRVACALVPDPCFWSPDLPSLYEVRVEIREGDGVIDSATRWLGIRYFGARGRSLYLEGRRWVVRGIERSAVEEPDLARWRELSAAMVVEEPDARVCAEASRQGILLIAHIVTSGDQVACRLRELSQWAAVAIFLLQPDAGTRADPRSVAPNLLLAQYVRASEPLVPQSWAHMIARDVDDPALFASKLAPFRLPVLAIRRSSRLANLREARAACDRLQRDLAPHMDAAGYLV